MGTTLAEDGNYMEATKKLRFFIFKFRASIESHILRNVWGARNVMKNQTGREWDHVQWY